MKYQNRGMKILFEPNFYWLHILNWIGEFIKKTMIEICKIKTSKKKKLKKLAFEINFTGNVMNANDLSYKNYYLLMSLNVLCALHCVRILTTMPFFFFFFPYRCLNSNCWRKKNWGTKNAWLMLNVKVYEFNYEHGKCSITKCATVLTVSYTNTFRFQQRN